MGHPVANIKSQTGRNKQNEKARLRNKSVRSELKTRTQECRTRHRQRREEAGEIVRQAIKRIDKAASRGRIHKNQAARRKVASSWLRYAPTATERRRAGRLNVGGPAGEAQPPASLISGERSLSTAC